MPDPFQSSTQIKPEQVLDIIVRRRWLILIPLCISLTLGLAATLLANKTYMASTLILVQQQSVPTEYVRSVVTSSINQRINTISQQILSRSNLEKIIDQFGLYENQPTMYLEDKIAGMRNRINVRIERARHGAEAFSISFKGGDPGKVMRIANTLASFFMDENLKVREAQAIGTSEFLDSELEKTRRRLEDRERRLSDYRSKYLGGLPDELETNLRTLDRLQEQLAAKNEELRETKSGLNLVDSKIADARREAQAVLKATGTAETTGIASGISDTREKLLQAEQAYENLLASYTEKHPDVIRAKKSIEKLKKSLAHEEGEPQPSSSDTSPAASETRALTNSTIRALTLSRSQLMADIEKLKGDINTIEEKMVVYQNRVEDTPKRELELQSLKRDYNNIRDIFNSLLDRKLEAELSVNMEKKQKGEQFRILDHARMPEKPISPNVKKFFLLSLIAGLGLGGCIIFLLEFFDTTLRRDEQIEDDLELTILASIPKLKGSGDKNRSKLEALAFLAAFCYMAGVTGFFMILNVKGLDRTFNFIKMYVDI
ncbi:MAG TPA: protein GumC [Desulfobacteraceae bacterium]|nr:protein GumC [Desulfobacteraceae bacterium]|tara:strand:+ start:2117 stop:3751 length:1635 start_codon:yes stop_codon:yes gene_type:complete